MRKAGLFQEMKRRVAYEKPSVKRKRKQAAARRSGARRCDEWNATVSSPPVKVIRMHDYGPRLRTAVHAEQVHDQIAQALKASSRVRLDFADIESVGETFLDRSLGALVAWRGATVFRLLVFAHCSPSVAASVGKAFPQAGPIRGAVAEEAAIG